MSKNYSINEQLYLLSKKYKKTYSIDNIFNSDYFISTEKIIDLFLDFFKDDYVIINASFFKENISLIENTTILKYNNSIVSDEFNLTTNYFIKKDLIIKDNSNGSKLYFDTSLLKLFFLNNKTINHFSFAIFSKKTSFYIMRRGHINILFKL